MENLLENLWSLSAQKYFWLEEPEIKEEKQLVQKLLSRKKVVV